MSEHVEKAPMNDTGSRPIEARSRFPYNYDLAGTYRFGEYGVNLVQDYVPNEDVPLYSGHTVRSMNLKAPLMGSIKLHKEYFDIPLPVLLPMNYEKVFVQPKIGEDVDASEVGLNVQGFDFRLKQVFTAWWSKIFSYVDVDSDEGEVYISSESALASLVKWFICAERFYSKGCLLSSLGIQLGKTFSYDSSSSMLDPFDHAVSFDSFFDYFYNSLLWPYLESYSIDSASGTRLYIDSVFVNCSILDKFQVLEKLRDASDISFVGSLGSVEHFDVSFFGYVEESYFFPSSFSIITAASLDDSKPLSMARPMAYQCACAEFFTNSNVDYMYSAALWRQFLRALYDDYGMAHSTFTWNGVSYEYDYCSAYYVSAFLSAIAISLNSSLSDDNFFVDWSRLIFGYNRSLRYVDYFTGSRTRPLAVGDVNVQVNSGYVNIIDTITKRWYAKFLNQVNRAKRKLSDYARALFPGLVAGRDYHDPMWLAHVEDDINSPEVEGTVSSDNMTKDNTTTSVLRSNGDRYAFEFSTNQYYGVVIGIIYFDIKRYYTDIIERPNFYVDRNDYFNPFLQFVGDQKVYRDELYSPALHSEIFGYQSRYTELKQRVDYCFGAFSEDGGLDGWLFIAKSPVPSEGESWHISPDYIRSRPSEMTPFYSSLTHCDLAKYFHFIVINKNVSDISAPMVYNPQLD